METPETNKFTLDGVEYNTEDLSDKGKYLVFNLNELQLKRQKTERKVSQYIAAEKTFVDELRQEIKTEEAGTEEVETGA